MKDNMPTNHYDAKRLMSNMKIELKKTNYCIGGSMLFYYNNFVTNDEVLEECDFYESQR